MVLYQSHWKQMARDNSKLRQFFETILRQNFVAVSISVCQLILKCFDKFQVKTHRKFIENSKLPKLIFLNII